MLPLISQNTQEYVIFRQQNLPRVNFRNFSSCDTTDTVATRREEAILYRTHPTPLLLCCDPAIFSLSLRAWPRYNNADQRESSTRSASLVYDVLQQGQTASESRFIGDLRFHVYSLRLIRRPAVAWLERLASMIAQRAALAHWPEVKLTILLVPTVALIRNRLSSDKRCPTGHNAIRVSYVSVEYAFSIIHMGNTVQCCFIFIIIRLRLTCFTCLGIALCWISRGHGITFPVSKNNPKMEQFWRDCCMPHVINS